MRGGPGWRTMTVTPPVDGGTSSMAVRHQLIRRSPHGPRSADGMTTVRRRGMPARPATFVERGGAGACRA